jgi:hypothetical protein
MDWIPAAACPRMLESRAGMTNFCDWQKFSQHADRLSAFDV